MGESVTFAGLNIAAIDEYTAFLAEQLRAVSPGLNLRPGSVLYELLLRKAATTHVYETTANLDALRDRWNLAAIAADPANADDATVDALLSNFNTSRQVGLAATGVVEVSLSTVHALVIAAGTQFTTADTAFRTLLDYAVVATADDKVNDSDLVLSAKSDGTYAFQLPVTATSVGPAGNIAAGTALTMSPPAMFLASAKALADFSGGSAAETNANVLQRAAAGVTAKILSTADQAAALLTQAIPSTTAVSVIGMGRPEMRRDQRSLLGTANGGRVDVYLRSQSYASVTAVPVTATLVDAATSTYQATLDRDAAAGAYEVVAVKSQAAGLLAEDIWADQLLVTGTTWSYDISNLSHAPDVRSAAEAAFTRYQTVTIEFQDPSHSGTYTVWLRGLPGIAAAQAYCDDAQHRDPLADWLVRASTAILVSGSLRVRTRSGVSVDTAAVSRAAAEAVNSQSFTAELNASALVSAAAAVLPAGAYVALPVDLCGRLIDTAHRVTMLRGANSLSVPTDYANGVSKSTVAFFTTPSAIDVVVEVQA